MEYIVLEVMEVKSWLQIREIEYDGKKKIFFFISKIFYKMNYFSYDWECVLDHPVLEEDHSILSFRNGLQKIYNNIIQINIFFNNIEILTRKSVSKDENYALLNIKQQGLHLWDIKCNSLVSYKIFFKKKRWPDYP